MNPELSRRRRWPYVLGGLVAVLAVVVAMVLRHSDDGSPTAPTDSGAPVAPLDVAGADGCLGGPDPRHAVVYAQQHATLDSVGAAEFAMAFTRFAVTHPYGPDVEQVLGQVMTDPSTITGIPAVNAKDQAIGRRVRVIPPLRYRVLNNNGGAAVVNVSYVLEVDSSDPASAGTDQLGVSAVHLTVVDGHWATIEAVGADPAGDPTFTTGFVDYANPGCGE